MADGDSIVSIATRYGMDGPGIKYQWERNFSQPSRLALGPKRPAVQWVKRKCCGVTHPPSSTIVVKRRIRNLFHSILLRLRTCLFYLMMGRIKRREHVVGE